MLSLSIYCSSQTISIALYQRQNLINYIEEIITSRKIDKIFLILKKILRKKKEKLDNIYFSIGPGSYTAIRSIKSIAQAISLISKAKVISIKEFEIYLANEDNLITNAFVYNKGPGDKFFYQFFRLNRKLYKASSDCFIGSIFEVMKFVKMKKFFFDDLHIITDNHENLKSLSEIKVKKISICKPCAKKLAQAIFNGYGSKKLKIIYPHSYYE